MALINYIPLVEREWPIKFIHPFSGIIENPFGGKLKQYIEGMKEKQKILEEL